MQKEKSIKPGKQSDLTIKKKKKKEGVIHFLISCILKNILHLLLNITWPVRKFFSYVTFLHQNSLAVESLT